MASLIVFRLDLPKGLRFPLPTNAKAKPSVGPNLRPLKTSFVYKLMVNSHGGKVSLPGHASCLYFLCKLQFHSFA